MAVSAFLLEIQHIFNLMNKISTRLLFLSLVIFTAACRVVPDAGEVIVTADPEFNVDLFEQRSPDDGLPTFGLWIESLKIYDSSGYEIETKVKIQNQDIAIQVLSVKKPAIGTGEPGPATAFVTLGALANGVYHFSLSLGIPVLSEGTLTVNDGHYELSIPEPQGVIFQNMVLERVPENMIWGYAETPGEAQEPLADAFILDLKTITADPGLAPGFYGYFTVTGAGGLFFHRSFAPKGPADIFVRRLTASPDALGALLQSHRSAGQTSLNIRCLTTFGEK